MAKFDQDPEKLKIRQEYYQLRSHFLRMVPLATSGTIHPSLGDLRTVSAMVEKLLFLEKRLRKP